MRQYKLLYLITDLGMGGAQTALLQVLRKLDPERFQAAVACFYGGNSRLSEEIRELGVTVTDLGIRSTRNVMGLWRYFRLLRRYKPDLVHASLFHACLLSRVMGRLVPTPVNIGWRHSVELGSPFRERLNRLTVRWENKLVAVCEPVKRAELENGGGPPDRVVVLPNCVDLEQIGSLAKAGAGRLRRAFGIPESSIIVGMVGRLHQSKGVDILLQAMRPIVREHLQIKLLIVGDGPLKEELVVQAARLGITEATVFTGLRSDIPSILGELDLLVLPSLWEGLPMVILEAMSARVPVIATNVGGNSEAVVHGKTGLLVPPGDVASLAQAIQQLASDGKLRRTMGEAGHERARKLFSADVVTRKFEALYLGLLAERGVA